MKNDFDTDNAYSQSKDITDKLDNYYRGKFKNIVRIERVYDKERQLKGIDVVIHFLNGHSINIDEKIRRGEWNDIVIEVYSDKNKKKKGWIFGKHTDYICYYFESGRLYLFPYLLLQSYFFNQIIPNYQDYKTIDAVNQHYTTLSVIVPFHQLFTGLKAEMSYFVF